MTSIYISMINLVINIGYILAYLPFRVGWLKYMKDEEACMVQETTLFVEDIFDYTKHRKVIGGNAYSYNGYKKSLLPLMK